MTADESPAAYGSPEHAATEALAAAAHEDWVQGCTADVAAVVIDGLRERGFIVTNQPRCECGWTGFGNHYHDNRMGREAR